MKKFKIPVYWEVYGTLTIEADTLEEALDIAHENEDVLPLPINGEYIEGTFTIDDNLADVFN